MTQRVHKRRYAVLPVCDVCDRVGRVPQHGMGRSRMSIYCTGPVEAQHSKEKMREQLFVESRAKVKTDV